MQDSAYRVISVLFSLYVLDEFLENNPIAVNGKLIRYIRHAHNTVF